MQREAAIELAATPIGNSADATPALLEALAGADLIAAEDTTRLLNLAGRLGVQLHGRVISCHDHNEVARAPQLLEAFRAGKRVLVVSDAGMPTVSDPGLAIVRAAIAAGVPVRVLPGPSAVLAALALSGFATDRFCFEGFLPRRGGERTRALAEICRERRTVIFFESPRRLLQTLADLEQVCGPQRQIAVCREISKVHEQTLRGSIAAVRAQLGAQVRGEITVVLQGAEPEVLDLDTAARTALELVADQGMKLKEASKRVASDGGPRAGEIYQRAIELR